MSESPQWGSNDEFSDRRVKVGSIVRILCPDDDYTDKWGGLWRVVELVDHDDPPTAICEKLDEFGTVTDMAEILLSRLVMTEKGG
jgi:hypothetical protein